MRPGLVRDTSAWDAPSIEAFLDASRIPVRLACLAAPGQPLVCSLWFDYHDDAVWCATRSEAYVARVLREHDRCAFEIAGDPMPYRGVRGQGRATLDEAAGETVLCRLIDRYLGTRETAFARWLLARADDEVAVRIDPDWLTAWDFTARMNR